MHAVILAAGKGTRMGALTVSVPKPMLSVNGKSLLAHKLEALSGICTEVIIVVGYQEHVIRDTLGDRFGSLPIRYAVQEELNGTDGAVRCAEPLITGRFIVLMGDDLYSDADITRVAKQPEWALLVKRTSTMGTGGSMVVAPSGQVTGIAEGDHRGMPGIMNTNLMLLDRRYFGYPPVPKAPGSHEFGLPHTAVAAARDLGISFMAVDASGWIQVTAPEDLPKAEALLAGLE